MANVAVRNERAGQVPTVRRQWDPWRQMQELMRWDPFTAMTPAWSSEAMTFDPDFDVKETKEAFEFKADVPGMKPEDFDVKMNNNRLTITGKREEEKTDKDETRYVYERSFGSFSRSFTMPEGVDAEKISADLKDGVLNVRVPKMPQAQPRQISVKG